MRDGPSSDEIRAALKDADDSQTPHYRDDTRESARTLAAAYREAIDALRRYHDIWPDIDHEANATSCNACAVLAKAEEVRMVSSDEIRVAMSYSPELYTDADEDLAAMEWSRDTLEACVRELYEALDDCYHCYMLNEGGSANIDEGIKRAVTRYRAALEGGNSESR